MKNLLDDSMVSKLGWHAERHPKKLVHLSQSVYPAPGQRSMEAVEELYIKFRKYNLKPHIEGCPCCTTEEDNNLLHSTSLRQLQHTHLQKYYFSGLLTFGDVDDFKHVLPRVCELMVTAPEQCPVNIEIILSKFSHAEFWKWPADEYQCVTRFLLKLWEINRQIIIDDQRTPDFDEWFCGLSLAFPTSDLILSAWENDTSMISQLNIIRFFTDNYRSIKKNKLSNAFWNDSENKVSEIIAWFKSGVYNKTLTTLLNSDIPDQYSEIINFADFIKE